MQLFRIAVGVRAPWVQFVGPPPAPKTPAFPTVTRLLVKEKFFNLSDVLRIVMRTRGGKAVM